MGFAFKLLYLFTNVKIIEAETAPTPGKKILIVFLQLCLEGIK